MYGLHLCEEISAVNYPTAIGRDSAGEQERAVYLFDKFVKERIQPESQKSVFDPIKRSKHLLHLISH